MLQSMQLPQKKIKIYLNGSKRQNERLSLFEDDLNVHELSVSLKTSLIESENAIKFVGLFPQLLKLQILNISIGKSVFAQEMFQEHLFRAVSQLNHLQKLKLKMRIINLKGVKQGKLLSSCLRNLFNLTDLSITLIFEIDTNFEEQGFNLSEAYSQLINLNTYKIYIINAKRQHSIACFFEGLRNLRTLKNLSISFERSQLNINKGTRFLFSEISSLTQLEELSILIYYSNRIQQVILQDLSNCLKSLIRLKKLILLINDYQYYVQNSSKYFSECFRYLKSLEYLSYEIGVEMNPLRIEDILKSVQQLTKLNKLKLTFHYCHQFTYYSKQCESLYQLLALIPQLQYFSLQLKTEIQIENCFVFALYSSFSRLNSLNILKIRFDSLIYLKKTRIRSIIQEKETVQEVLSVKDLIFNFSIEKSKELLSWLMEQSNNQKQLNNQEEIKSQLPLDNGLKISQNLSFELENIVNFEIVKPEGQIKDIADEDLFFQIIQKMKKLKFLTLRLLNQSISEQSIETLMSSLANADQLITLDITLNKLNNKQFKLFSSILRTREKLENISMEFLKDLSISDILCILEGFRDNCKLRYLKLTISCEGDDGMNSRQLFDQLGNTLINKEYLNYLELNLNFKHQISALDMKELILSLSTLDKLTSLHIKLNQSSFTQDDLLCLRQLLKQLKYLNSLSFVYNTFGSIYLANLIQDLPFLTHFQFTSSSSLESYFEASKSSLYLDENENSQISDQQSYKGMLQYVGCYFERYGVMKYQEIKELNFNFDFLTHLTIELRPINHLGFQGAEHLFTLLSQLAKLVSLKIFIRSENAIGTKSIVCLGESIKKLSTLTELVIFINSYQNQIVWEEAFCFVEGLQNLSKLETFEFEMLFCGRISEQNLKRLFESISQLKDLQTLTLKLNQQILQDTLIEYMRIGFEKLVSLKFLNFGIDPILKENKLKQQLFGKSMRNLMNLLSFTSFAILKLSTISISLFKQKRLVNIKMQDISREYLKKF